MENQVTIDSTISLYEGLIVRDRKLVLMSRNDYPSEQARRQRDLDRDKLILGALKCAKAHGFTGEA